MPPTSEHVLEVIELSKIFRDFWGRESVRALDSLNFEVDRGEVFGLLGPNGSGKTTTVRIVLGLLFPTAGAVRLFGRTPRNVEVKKRVGYMPEESHLYPYLTAQETLDFFGRIFRLSSEERAQRTEALLEMVGLNRARHRPLGQYSKGMARRIGLAQALINDPDFLILDEPTTGLDPIGTREMKDLILTLRERGKTILLCSHLLADVEEVCDRVCILYGGKRRALGAVDELLVSREITQIRAPRLDEGTLGKVMELIRSSAGGEDDIEVSAPTRRLEDFFLDVVAQARRERLQTAGADMGKGTAAFLGSREDEGETLVDELVKAGVASEQQAPEQEGPVAAAQAVTPQRDEAFIEDLTRAASAAGPAEAETELEEAPAAAAPQDRVRQEILDELVHDAEKDGRGDEDDPS